MVKSVSISKPKSDKVLDFAEGKKEVPKAVPKGDVRLTTNMRKDLHRRLKIEAAKQGTTIGELVEQLVEENIPK